MLKRIKVPSSLRASLPNETMSHPRIPVYSATLRNSDVMKFVDLHELKHGAVWLRNTDTCMNDFLLVCHAQQFCMFVCVCVCV